MSYYISVIIPAYNVEHFIEKAIRSVLIQPEVKEVVVVNDGSTDKTLQVLETLQSSNSKIKIYHHLNKVNRGRSASRNLGIIHARENYIAFLDADDFYLEKRFENDQIIFENNTTVDGVYNAVGFHYYREATETEKGIQKLNSLSQIVQPQDLFEALISSKYGYLHLNGITVKKSVFDTIGYFNESLVVAEDSDIIFKMALKCSLKACIIKTPLALRGVHEDNIFNNETLYKKYNIKLYESLISWSLKNHISKKNIDLIFNWLWVVRFRSNYLLLNDILYWGVLFLKFPKLLFSYLSIKYFPVIRLRKKLFSFLYK
ncbi:hypothetical protein C1A40_00965 [Tamlana carrageenivorans]|uniref:Glycosyltransferase 2-like domain-containing protein n=2 Tax=Pseudotamlana carrageenivorans TaxID=2069432 RepID=A0A2I7SE11_9FLAO|nr:hypothetical protein C1A40_00965 [Tamlana carrageenivorans]